ncbi:glycoside hydrolase family 3 C-terminal domain-containing protein [Flavobacteriaceae bacterium KMM 6897]|nr:glycoside hydrolase family 3 C-terminal domain-containing protein [Flavobacteriaceae bacterium KMM 6897]MEB8347184.1 glycoside hydrolase family 3 C-terminal domain-containing protein [Flavobacteriaceae bacterium KMM 6898]
MNKIILTKQIVKLFFCAILFSSTIQSQVKGEESAKMLPKVDIDYSAWGSKESLIQKKVDSLLSIMTLEEKIGQTVLYSSGWTVTGPTLDKNYTDYLKKGMVGALFNAKSAKYTREMQKIAVENTRLGIPLLFGFDVIHGYKTIFPIPLGEAASWDLDIMEKTAGIAAAEAAASGLHWTYAPMVDIARDPRWGRISEGAGEDVFLGSAIAKARVKGFQGKDLADVNTVLACVKHYAAYGAALAGRDYHSVDMSERELRDTYLPPFIAATEAGVATFMTSFNEISGIPSSGNDFLLDDVLRGEWEFDGFVVTDYTSINEMVPHGFSKDEKHAGEQAINAGVDMDMQGGIFLNHLKPLVAEEKVSVERINEAARKILSMKYRLGLFEDPYRYSNEVREEETIYKAEYMAVAKEAATKSMVLLKNENRTLPLKKNAKIALVGPLAKDEAHILGSWAAEGDRQGKAISVYEGLENMGILDNIQYAKGCEIDSDSKEGFQAALEAASQSDVVVMVLGESEHMSGEAASRTNIDLPGVQKELIAEIKKTGKPIILVLMNGRPLTLEYEAKTVDAILEAWQPGTMGGAAIVDNLFGIHNPSGKLPVTFPRNIGQIPIYYNMKNTGRPIDPNSPNQDYRSNYIDAPNTPLFPFGYGLSYTDFIYSKVTLNTTKIRFNESLKAFVTIKNNGAVAGEEIVQLYIRDLVGSVTRPVKELKGFKKIMLEPGQEQTVEFTITSKDLRFYNRQMDFTAEPGDFDLFIGTNSDTGNKTSFELIK